MAIVNRDLAVQSASASADQIACAFCDHDHRCVDVAADEVGKHGGVDDAQSFRAVHAKRRIHHRQAIRSHPTGSGRMMCGDRRCANDMFQLVVITRPGERSQLF